MQKSAFFHCYRKLALCDRGRNTRQREYYSKRKQSTGSNLDALHAG